jgi:hypothetical protein
VDIKAIKELAQKYTAEELLKCADELENKGQCACSQKSEPGEAMSDVLQAYEVRKAVDEGTPLQEAVRDFSKRVRACLT